MDNKMRCQSCGMPLDDGFYGINSDGSTTMEYCKFCWQNGGFTNPTQTLEEMIESSIKNMTSEVGIPEAKAHELANTFIPKLKRWDKK